MPQPRAIVPDQGGVNVGINNTGVTIPARRLVKRSTTVDSIVLAVDGNAAYAGVTMAAILPGQGGDVQVERRPLLECGAAVPIGSKVMADAAGKGIVATAGKYAIGVANTAALVDTDIIELDIDAIVLPV